MEKDFYKILGIERNASQEEINKAYRSIAIETHPDRNPNNPETTEKFKEASEAFEILSNPQKRSQYDMFGSNQHGSTFGGQSPFGFNFDPFSMFEDLFGDHARQRQSSQHLNLHQEIEITLDEAYAGCEKEILIQTNNACKKCNASGVLNWEKCNACDGSGSVHNRNGNFSITMKCTRCRGIGKTPKDNCDVCLGEGYVKLELKKKTITIPKGIESGNQILIRGGGGENLNGSYGDLICLIKIQQHILYERKQCNLIYTLPITFAQSILGQSLLVPFLCNKKYSVKINPGTRSGDVLKLKQMGMPMLDREGHYGDLFIKIQIDTPTNPSEEYKELVSKLAILDHSELYQDITKFEHKSSQLNVKDEIHE